MDVSKRAKKNENGGDKMNNKDLKKLLKSQLEHQIPDILSKIDLQSIEILDKPRSRFMGVFKQRFASLSIVLVASVLLIIALISIQNPKDPLEIPMTLTAEKTYSFSAISSSTLLNSIELQLNNEQMILLSSMMQQETKMKQRVGLLNPYFNMIELFISSDTNLSFSDPVTSTLPNYTYQVTYQILNLNDELSTYVFHYNETTVDEGTYTEGLLVLDRKQFYLEGLKTVDGDEIVITTKTYHDPLLKELNYVEFISTEIGDDQWFEYNVFQNGVKIEKSTVNLEKIGENMRIRLKYEHEIDDIEVELKAMRILTNSIWIIKAEYDYKDQSFEEEGNIVVSVVLDPINQTNQYRYEITNKKGDKDDYMGGRGHHNNNDDDEFDDESDDDDDEPGKGSDNRP